MHLYILLGLLYTVKNMNVPTYLKQVMVYIPIGLSFGVFHIAKFLVFQNWEPKQVDTNREASTVFAASIN